MRLTPRQGQVAVLVAEGHTNSSIGAILGCSERTVEVHVSSILARASASSRAELVARLALYDS
ncbi:MAG: helix-turn-helix transcriptional regulator [Polyangiaceae bacterium]